MINMPVKLITGQIATDQARIVSVKGIYDIFSQMQKTNNEQEAKNQSNQFLYTFWFMGTISIALGFTNLLPIPALDGGRILFLLPELIFKKKVNQVIEARIHSISFALLISLMAVLVICDFINPVA
jgi:regulator of sigma E protease